jgi:hypothetical protein
VGVLLICTSICLLLEYVPPLPLEPPMSLSAMYRCTPQATTAKYPVARLSGIDCGLVDAHIREISGLPWATRSIGSSRSIHTIPRPQIIPHPIPERGNSRHSTRLPSGVDIVALHPPRFASLPSRPVLSKHSTFLQDSQHLISTQKSTKSLSLSFLGGLLLLSRSPPSATATLPILQAATPTSPGVYKS